VGWFKDLLAGRSNFFGILGGSLAAEVKVAKLAVESQDPFVEAAATAAAATEATVVELVRLLLINGNSRS
jgi:hypothetical protein